jgi:maltose/maltodextrin transport system substrate-binding protein/arabinogalactan oligomer/maltooligosaccharide transport system substrate-binding protein
MMGSADIRDQLGVAGPAGEGPDILIGAHDWLGQLVSNGLLEPIDLGDKRDQFLEAALQAYTYNGELYGMPYQMDNVAFFRNTDLVPEAPETWTEVTQIATQLESAGEVELGYVRQEGDPYHFFPIQTAFGGYVFGTTEDGSYDPTDVGIDSPGTIAAAQWLQEMVENGHMKAGIDYDIMHTMFEEGRAAMIVTGPWALPRLRDSGVPYAISDIPNQRADGRPFIGVQGFMINSFSRNKLLAQTFLTEFIATEEVMVQLYEAVPRPVAYEPAQDDISSPDIAAFGEVGANGAPMPAIPEMSAVWSAWTDAIVLVTQGQQDAKPAFENAAEQIRNTIEGE